MLLRKLITYITFIFLYWMQISIILIFYRFFCLHLCFNGTLIQPRAPYQMIHRVKTILKIFSSSFFETIRSLLNDEIFYYVFLSLPSCSENFLSVEENICIKMFYGRKVYFWNFSMKMRVFEKVWHSFEGD